MRNVRNALFAMFVLGGVAALASQSGIEVLRVSGIEVLRVDTHTTGAPLGSTVWAVTDVDGAPVVVDLVPVDPATGNASVIFPLHNQTSRVELHDPTGVLMGGAPIDPETIWD
jgi:hypothetical protein